MRTLTLGEAATALTFFRRGRMWLHFRFRCVLSIWFLRPCQIGMS